MDLQIEIDKCSSVEEAVEYLKYRENYPKSTLREFKHFRSMPISMIIDEAYKYFYTPRSGGKTVSLLSLFMQHCRHSSVNLNRKGREEVLYGIMYGRKG